MNQWAQLRQVGFGTLDHTAAVQTATELLELGPGFDDPVLGPLDLPAARTAHAARTTKVDDILAVDVAVDTANPTGFADPAALARTWAAIIGIAPPAVTADGAELAFGHRTIRFVAARNDRTGIVAVDLHATDRQNPLPPGDLCHTQIRFV